MLVQTPSVSAQAVAGKTTSATLAVSVMKMSTTTRQSRLFSACSQWWRSGSVTSVFSPSMIIAWMPSPHRSSAVTLVIPVSRSTLRP